MTHVLSLTAIFIVILKALRARSLIKSDSNLSFTADRDKMNVISAIRSTRWSLGKCYSFGIIFRIIGRYTVYTTVVETFLKILSMQTGADKYQCSKYSSLKWSNLNYSLTTHTHSFLIIPGLNRDLNYCTRKKNTWMFIFLRNNIGHELCIYFINYIEYLKDVNYLTETILMIVHIVILVFWTPSQR